MDASGTAFPPISLATVSASLEYVSEEQGAQMNGYVEIMRANIEAI